MSKDRQWLPEAAELIDRLSIHQLKEWFLPEEREAYASDIGRLKHDIDMLLEGKPVSAALVHAIVVLAQINTHIWYNESQARMGGDQDVNRLKLTHTLNGVRSRTTNYIAEIVGGQRRDHKTDCLAAEYTQWEPSLLKR